MYSRLRQALVAFQQQVQSQQSSWDKLIQEAEKQGVAPLLFKHIRSLDDPILPDKNRRILQSLYLRNRRSNSIRNKAIAELLNSYQLTNIDVLVVKGIALSNFCYSEAGLRPMRDIDLLVKKSDLVPAEKILLDLGYLPEEEHDIPDDYYHLVPMKKKFDGLNVTIEVHHNLLPFHAQYPLWPLEKSYNTALEFDINGIMARTLCLEETLYYVYLHGFQAPLTYEPFRFMHVADMVTLVEKFIDVINWQQVRKEMPLLLNAISRFHYLTPLPDKVVSQLDLNVQKHPGGAGIPYKGWPKRKIAAVQKTKLLQLSIDTFWPSQWWMQIYYGHLSGINYFKARLFDHPRMVWRWVKAYLHLYIRTLKENKEQKKHESKQ